VRSHQRVPRAGVVGHHPEDADSRATLDTSATAEC
jgi:hypothetical protein